MSIGITKFDNGKSLTTTASALGYIITYIPTLQ